MFRAIGRYFRAIGYLLVGKVDAARMSLTTSPYVVQATFDHIIAEKRKRIQQYKDAVGAMIAQEEKKKAELKLQSEDVVRIGKLQEGAAAMARKVVARLGSDVEAVKNDPDYLKCQSAFKDFGSTLEEKEARCTALESDVRTIQESIGGHKIQIQTLMREFEKIKQEKHETVADIITAKEEKELVDLVAGIGEDRSSRELQEMRELRHKARGTARISREVAGMDTKHLEQEFLEYATSSAADNEFDALIGLTKRTDEGPDEPKDKTRIPES